MADEKGPKSWFKKTFGDSKTPKKMTIREYAEYKGLPMGNIYTTFKLLKAAREDGIEVTANINSKMPIVENVTMGRKITEGIDAGEIEFNSLDENLDFDKLAQEITGNEEMTWDAHMLELEKEEREAEARMEAERIETEAKEKVELETLGNELKGYTYAEALEKYTNPETANGFTVVLLRDALAVIKACENGESPHKAMNRLQVEKTSMVMTLISDIYIKGPELYKTYIEEHGLAMEDLNEETQERIKGLEERNARYDMEAEREKGFTDTLAKVTDDAEYVEFVDGEETPDTRNVGEIGESAGLGEQEETGEQEQGDEVIE